MTLVSRSWLKGRCCDDGNEEPGFSAANPVTAAIITRIIRPHDPFEVGIVPHERRRDYRAHGARLRAIRDGVVGCSRGDKPGLGFISDGSPRAL
jgi:hypothetical protein